MSKVLLQESPLRLLLILLFKKVILLLVDQQILLDLLATVVDAFSEISTVSKATTCAQAITVSKDMPVDLAILDLHLPDGDGSELGLRLVQSNPSIQLIVLTGAPEDQDFA